jgi:hypothetical protein
MKQVLQLATENHNSWEEDRDSAMQRWVGSRERRLRTHSKQKGKCVHRDKTSLPLLQFKIVQEHFFKK